MRYSCLRCAQNVSPRAQHLLEGGFVLLTIVSIVMIARTANFGVL
jgi:hypothetical protein